MSTVSRNKKPEFPIDLALELKALRDEPLHPDLVPYVEDMQWGKMVRHPLIYDLMIALPGQTNRAYLSKVEALDEAVREGYWADCVWLHERPYRLKALIDYATGRDDDGEIIPLVCLTDWHRDLASHVWTDSENIQQCIEDWRALFAHEPGTLWFGDREAFNALDWAEDGTVLAYRGGAVGDWSWTVNLSVAEFFSRRSGCPVRESRIHRDECFAYLTHRSEYELLVRLTPERTPLVYPDAFPETEED